MIPNTPEQRRLAILNALNQIPPLPSAAVELLRLIREDKASAAEMADSLRLDPGLTANVLKLANSSAHAGGGVIDVGDAVARLGMRAIANLAVAGAAVSMLDGSVTGYDLPPGCLLAQSLGVALGVEALAFRLGIRPPAHAFTAGLLATVGKVVLGAFVEVDVASVIETALAKKIPFHEAEKLVLGIDHAQVGAVLLKRWNLPPEIVSVVRYRLDPDSAPAVDPALDLVHAADAMVRLMGVGVGLDALFHQPSAAVIERLGLDEALIEDVLADLFPRVREAAARLAPNKPEINPRACRPLTHH